MKFNEKLIELRKKEGLSQEELGYKLNVTRQTVSKWELGQTTPEMEKLVEISKIFNITVDELVKDIEVSCSEKEYKESCVEKNNKKISIRIFIIGIIIALILGGVGLIRQNNASKTNEERKQQVMQESQTAADNANARLKQIEQELVPLKEQYEAKQQERDSLNMRDADWFEKVGKLDRESSNINSQINALEQEKFRIVNKDYTVYYQLVEPLTYNIFYYISAGVFALMSLIALIYYLATRKK